MMQEPNWQQGAPDQLQAGMLLDIKGHGPVLVGTDHPKYKPEVIVRWCWIIKPHELEWVAEVGW